MNFYKKKFKFKRLASNFSYSSNQKKYLSIKQIQNLISKIK